MNTLVWSGDDEKFVRYIRCGYGTEAFFGREEVQQRCEQGIGRTAASFAARELGGIVIEPMPDETDGESLVPAAVLAQLDGSSEQLAGAMIEA